MMKFLIVYSSRTGNTRQVAEALYAAAPDGSTISNVETAPAADGYDVIFVGYWMDRGTADEKSKAYLRTLTKKKVVLFETMGASPASEHAYTCYPRGRRPRPHRHDAQDARRQRSQHR